MKKLRIITAFYDYPALWFFEKEKTGDLPKDWIERKKELCALIHDESSFITEALRCRLYDYKIFPCTRLNIFFTDSEQGWPKKFSVFDSIGSVYIEFDINYPLFSKEEKTNYLLMKIEEAVLQFCDNYSVDTEPIKKVCAIVRSDLKEKNMLGPYFYKAYKTIYQNGIAARLMNYHSIDALHFYVQLSSVRIGRVEVPFFETPANLMSTIEPLGKFYWMDDETLCLENSLKGNPFSKPSELAPDKILSVAEYRSTHNKTVDGSMS